MTRTRTGKEGEKEIKYSKKLSVVKQEARLPLHSDYLIAYVENLM